MYDVPILEIIHNLCQATYFTFSLFIYITMWLNSNLFLLLHFFVSAQCIIYLYIYYVNY